MKTIRLLLKIYYAPEKFIVTKPNEFKQGIRWKSDEQLYWAAGLIRSVNRFGELCCPLEVINEYTGPWNGAQLRIIRAADIDNGGLMRWLLLKAAQVNA